MSINPTVIPNLIESNVSALRQGLELLTRLKPEQYTQACEPAFESTIGAHFRHALEHYCCFFNQLPQNLICYDKRERDQSLETELLYARDTLGLICDELETFDFTAYNGTLLVRDQQTLEPVPSSIERELLFLHAHTVHHYALIAAMARSFGVPTAEGFGVAIATLEHYREALGSFSNAGNSA